MNARDIVQLLHRTLEAEGLAGAEDALVNELRVWLEKRDLVLLCHGESLVVNGDDSASTLVTTRILQGQLRRVGIRRLHVERGIGATSLGALFRLLRVGDRHVLERQLGGSALHRVRIDFDDRAFRAETPTHAHHVDGTAALPVAGPTPAAMPVSAATASALESTAHLPWEVPDDPDEYETDRDEARQRFESRFVRLAVTRDRVEKNTLFAELARMPSGDDLLISYLGSQRRYIVLLSLALLGARKFVAADRTITHLFLNADRQVKLACLRTLEQLGATDRWITYQVGLKDDDPSVRLASLEAFDANPRRLSADSIRGMLLRERDEQVLAAIADRLARYRGSEVSRALAKITVYFIKEGGSIAVLRSLLHALLELQPQSAKRLGHYLRGSPQALRAALGDEIMTIADARMRDTGPTRDACEMDNLLAMTLADGLQSVTADVP